MSNHSRPPKRPIPSGKGGAIDVALAGVLRKSAERKAFIKRSTVGLYSLKVGDSLYGLPFCALSDDMALKAQKEILPQSNVFRVGSFCLFDGMLSRLSRPVLVLDNKVSHEKNV